MGGFEFLLLKILLLVYSNTRQVEAACPNGCHCQLSLTWINCSGLGLTEIPEDIPENVTVLILSHNLIEILETDTLVIYPDLIELNLNHNLIHTISPGAFNGAQAIAELDLSNNNLTELLPGSLQMSSAIEINLARNQLERIAVGAFVDCWFIAQVFLEDNRLSADVFSVLKTDLIVAQHLDLSRNPLKEIPYAALNIMPFLQFLVITEAEIERVDPNAFIGLASLTGLYLTGNKIDDLRREFFQPLDQVLELDISGNPILCQCPVKQFQDWLDENGFLLTDPTTCRDVTSGADLDIESGDLEYMCWGNFTSPWPPCLPGGGNATDCAEAAIEIHLEGDDGEIRLKWELVAIDMVTVAILGCRENGQEDIINTQLSETTGDILLPGVDTGHDVGCCIFVPTCLMHACADYVAPPGDDGADVALIVVSSILVLVVLIAIALVIYWLVWGRNSIYASAEDLPSEGRKQNSCNVANGPTSSSNNITKSPTIRSLGYRLSDSDGQYEVIDPKTFRSESKRSFENRAFENHERDLEAPVGHDFEDEVFTVSNQIPLPTETNHYLEPLPDLPEKKQARHFTKQTSEPYMNGGTWPRNTANQRREHIELHFQNGGHPTDISNPSYKTKNSTLDDAPISSQYLHFGVPNTSTSLSTYEV